MTHASTAVYFDGFSFLGPDKKKLLFPFMLWYDNKTLLLSCVYLSNEKKWEEMAMRSKIRDINRPSERKR